MALLPSGINIGNISIPDPPLEYWSDEIWCEGASNCNGRQKAPMCTTATSSSAPSNIDWNTYKSLFRKLIEYCENNIDGGDWTQVEDDFSSNLKVDFFNIPIDPKLGFWEDIEDETEEIISCHYDSLCDDLDKQLKEKAINKSDYKKIVDSYREEEKKIEELHANFFEELYEKRAKIVSWAEKIKEYCSSNNRILIRNPEYPLEIEKVANNLEESTIPVKEKKAKSK